MAIGRHALGGFRPYQKLVLIFCCKSYLIHTSQMFVVENKKAIPRFIQSHPHQFVECAPLGPVVQRWVNANPWLKFNPCCFGVCISVCLLFQNVSELNSSRSRQDFCRNISKFINKLSGSLL
jgi:hypothetical protein